MATRASRRRRLGDHDVLSAARVTVSVPGVDAHLSNLAVVTCFAPGDGSSRHSVSR